MATAGEDTWPRSSLPKPTGATAGDEEGISGIVREQIRAEGARAELAGLNSLQVFDPEFKRLGLQISS